MKKIRLLIVSNLAYNNLIRELINELFERYSDQIEIDVLTPNTDFVVDGIHKTYQYELKTGQKNKFLKKAFSVIDVIRLKRLVKQLPDYDIINIHFVEAIYSKLIQGFKLKSKNVVVSIWGSDFYRTSGKMKMKKKPVFDAADCFTFTNESMESSFKQFFSQHKEVKILRFGVNILQFIDKYRNESLKKLIEELGLPPAKKYVSIAYNGSPFQQHLTVLENLSELPKNIKETICFILPMTYAGSPEYIIKVEQLLKEYALQYYIFRDYLTIEQIAKLRLISDIMIHVPTTDQFSGSMLEALYADNLLISGSWLKYKKLDDESTFLFKVNEISEVRDKLIDLLVKLDEYKKETNKNRTIVYNLASWDINAQKWFELYKELSNKQI